MKNGYEEFFAAHFDRGTLAFWDAQKRIYETKLALLATGLQFGVGVEEYVNTKRAIEYFQSMIDLQKERQMPTVETEKQDTVLDRFNRTQLETNRLIGELFDKTRPVRVDRVAGDDAKKAEPQNQLQSLLDQQHSINRDLRILLEQIEL